MVFRYALSGFAAGTVTGILGSGGGLVLIPLLSAFCNIEEESLFPCCLGIMLPLCLCSAIVQSSLSLPSVQDFLPFFLGGTIGGLLSVLFRKKVSTIWLHRIFGCILLWSGFRCLFS